MKPTNELAEEMARKHAVEVIQRFGMFDPQHHSDETKRARDTYETTISIIYAEDGCGSVACDSQQSSIRR